MTERFPNQQQHVVDVEGILSCLDTRTGFHPLVLPSEVVDAEGPYGMVGQPQRRTASCRKGRVLRCEKVALESLILVRASRVGTLLLDRSKSLDSVFRLTWSLS